MKTLLLLITIMALATAASSQSAANPVKAGYTCSAMKADGQPCRMRVKMEGTKCHHHNPATERCGQTTAKGTPCRLPKSKGQTTCWRHKKTNG